MSEVVVKYDEPIEDAEGRRYMARAAARERDDGLWESWLEFVPIEERDNVLASERETTQPNRLNVEYWAQGLTRVYLEGALQRAINLTDTGDGAPAPQPQRELSAGPSVRRRPETETAASPKPRPVLDPYRVYSQGEEVLRSELSALSRSHVESIVAAYGFRLDGSPDDLRDAPKQALIRAVVEGVRSSEART